MAGIAFLDRFGLNPRERKLVVVLLGTVVAMLFLGIPIGIEMWVHSRRAAYEETRAAIAAVQNARGAVRERQAKKDAILQRYQKRAPTLAGFLEQMAREQKKLQVVDSVDRPEVPHGKRYTERNTIIHFKKANMAPLAGFLEAIERSGNAVAVTRLNIRKRTGEPDQYDVEVGVSAFDRNETPAPDAAKKEEKAL